MQKVYSCKAKSPAYYLQQENEKILHFSFQGALPEGHTVALNTAFGTLSYIVCDGGYPRLVGQEQFSSSEMSVLLPLLEAFPYYCPYEVMYASFYNGNVLESTVARCRQRLQEALEAGIWDQEIKPVRCALSRTRIKMRSFGVDIHSILETGYILMIASTLEAGEEPVKKLAKVSTIA